jgi:nucleotide-binding universal stress UspA family protein
MFQTIVWATDGSKAADRGLPFAEALAAAQGARLVVVHCKEIFAGGRASGHALKADEDELEAKIEGQLADLRERGVDAILELVDVPSGRTAHAIAEQAHEVGADVIVVATRGHLPVAGLLLGSVTQRLLHIADCPVLAVPPSAVRSGRSREGETLVTAG